MASASFQKKRQEERNSKLIRELATLPANKYCFDCGQRGPTYVNITVGSFCCAHCSGLLRGLNPPHRVKSISMATFTDDEINKLRTTGNEENAKIWLGLHDAPVKFEPVRLDENVKAHLIQKYENRRWYVSPSEIAEQKRLLEAHTRRDSMSGASIHSSKSNQSAPANLQQSSEKKSDFAGIFDDLMFSVKEEPQPTSASTMSIPTVSKPSQIYPPLSVPPNPLSSHSSTPQPLQFDIFSTPTPPAAPIAQAPVSNHAPTPTFDPFSSAIPPIPQKATDSFANFDAIFNSLSVNEPPAAPRVTATDLFASMPSEPVRTVAQPSMEPLKPVSVIMEPTKPVNSIFDTLKPATNPVIEAIQPSNSVFNTVKPVTSVLLEPQPTQDVKKDDGLPDYSALEALYKVENEPLDLFGFNKPPTNGSSSTASAANGFAKSSTIGDFGTPAFPPTAAASSGFSSANPGLSQNAFFSMNSFSSVTTAPTTGDSYWPPTTTTTNNTTAPLANWNPFS